MTRVVDTLESGPLFPADALGAYAAYYSVLTSLTDELQQLSEPDPQNQNLVLTVALPSTTQQFMALFQNLNAKVSASVA